MDTTDPKAKAQADLEAATRAGDHAAFSDAARRLEVLQRGHEPPPSPPAATTPAEHRVPKVKAVPATLPMDSIPAAWGDSARGMPNDLIRSALFNVRRNEPRKMLKDEVLASLRDTIVMFSGEEWRVRDEDVLMQIFHIQRNHPVGELWQVSGLDLLIPLRWGTGKRAYEDLYASLDRLFKGTLTIKRNRSDDPALGHNENYVIKYARLIDHLDIDRRGGRTNITIGVSKQTLVLWHAMGYTAIDWSQRLQLGSPLARFLHAFYSSHRSPHSYKVQTLMRLSGSGIASVRKFRQKLREALQSLVGIGFLKVYSIGEDDLVMVVRDRTTSNERNLTV